MQLCFSSKFISKCIKGDINKRVVLSAQINTFKSILQKSTGVSSPKKSVQKMQEKSCIPFAQADD